MFQSQLRQALDALDQVGMPVDPIQITNVLHMNVDGHRKTWICHRDDFGRTMPRKMIWWKPDGTGEVRTL